MADLGFNCRRTIFSEVLLKYKEFDERKYQVFLLFSLNLKIINYNNIVRSKRNWEKCAIIINFTHLVLFLV